MIYLVFFFLHFISAQGQTKRGLFVTGRYNETYKVDGYSSHKTYVNSVEGLLSNKIRDTYNFALQFSDASPAVLLSRTTPEKLVFLQLLHSFDSKKEDFTTFLLHVANSSGFPLPDETFSNWLNNSFMFPAKRIYQIIKFVATSKPSLPKKIAEQIFLLNVRYGILEEAAITGDAEVVRWLFMHSTGNNQDTIEFNKIEEVWKNGRVDIIELLMEFGKINKQNLPAHIVNEKMKNNETLLHVASRKGYDSTVNLLVTNLGANVNSKDVAGKSPLYRSVEHNKANVVEFLISKGADVQTEPLLALAVEKGNIDTIKRLLNIGVSIDMKNENGDAPFFLAVKLNNVKILEILSNNEDLKKIVLQSTDDFGNTLIHIAALKKFISSVKTLAGLGANINSRNVFGETPLYTAVKGQNLDVINFLIESKADVMTRTDLGDTIIHLAASLGNFDIVKLLVTQKFSFPINDKNSNGETSVYKAALSGKCELVKFLVKSGGDLNSNNDRMTMLHEAAEAGNDKAVTCLIDSGMDVDIRGLWDATPLHIAISRGQEKIVKILLEKKANPNIIINKNLWTPLHRAVLGQNVKIIKLLIEYGADINAKNGEGDSPCILVEKHQKDEGIRSIVKKHCSK